MCYDGLEFENGTLGEDEIDRARPRPTVERHEDDVDRYPLLSTTSQARQRSTGGDPLRPRKRGNAPRVATPSASQARQRSMGGDPFGLASEAALHGGSPLRAPSETEFHETACVR